MNGAETKFAGLQRSDLYLSSPYQQPESEVETALAGIWQQVLNIDIIGTQDDFFEIGGDSLAATLLASELEARFNCKFSPSNMIEYSTIASQVVYIDLQKKTLASGVNALPSCLTLFNRGGTKAPLFIVHGNRGFTILHKSFLAGFDSDQPVGFLEAPGLDGKESPLAHITEYAARYLDSLRQVAPEGNWLLAANCAGSLIAFEMCLLAEKAGEQVSRLMLIDPINGRRAVKELLKRGKKKSWRLRMLSRLKRRLRNLFSFPGIGHANENCHEKDAFEASVNDFAQRHRTHEKRIRARVENKERAAVPSNVAYNPDAMQKVSFALDDAYRAYSLKERWRGRSFILSSTVRSNGLKAWRRHLPNAVCQIVNHDHQGVFREGLPEVLKFLNEAMDSNPERKFQS